MRTIVFYDGDGGGWGGQLRSLVHAIAIAEYTGSRIVSFYPLLGRVFSLAYNNIVTADELELKERNRIRDYMDSNSLAYIEDEEHALDKRGTYLLAGKHHMPHEVAYNFHKINTKGLSLPVFSRKALCSLSLVDNNLSTYITNRVAGLELSSQYGAIQIRSFFDSTDGNKLFKERYSSWIGWLLDSLDKLKSNMGKIFPLKWLIITDNPDISRKVMSLAGVWDDMKFVSLLSQPVHTSVAFRLNSSLLRQRPSNILNQYWMDIDLLRDMYGDLAEWYLLSNASVILTTGTSYAGTADSAMRLSHSVHYSLCGKSMYCSSIHGPY